MILHGVPSEMIPSWRVLLPEFEVIYLNLDWTFFSDIVTDILEVILSCFMTIKIQADATGSSRGGGDHQVCTGVRVCMHEYYRCSKGYYKQCNCNLYSTYAINQLNKLCFDHVMRYPVTWYRSPTERDLQPPDTSVQSYI